MKKLALRHCLRLMTTNNPLGISLAVVCLGGSLFGQAMLPFMNAGPDSAFAQVDFAQIYMDTSSREMAKNAEEKEKRQHLVDIGAVSALDLDAPNSALEEYNRAATLMKAQNSKEAILHLQKAIKDYPKFVLAYNTLGLAYLDQQDGRAKGEFEEAVKLDAKFPGSFLNLGTLALAANDFATADANLEKAASLSPNDPKILTALAFAENGDRKYVETLQTVQRVHTLDHRGMANVHYIAAAAAMALNNFPVMERELNLFLSEDPTNPLAPVARKNLDALARRNSRAIAGSGTSAPKAVASGGALQTFPNSDRLRAQLNAVGTEPENENCVTCANPGQPSTLEASAANAPAPLALTRKVNGTWTIRAAVDETALFFAVSSHGHMVDDLKLSEIQLRDDEKTPEKIVQFLPQSKLPLRIGLLVDTSGSVRDRFSFEKHAAEKFLEKVLNGTSDLGFVAGFSNDTTVTRDFTSNPAELGKGVENLANGGGTSLFDAVSYASQKLGEYPEQGRVARVLVILSDGEDNSSHRSLKQSIEEAEAAGVTIYAVSTAEDAGVKSDADRVLQVLAERSGGEAIFPGDMMTFEKSLDRLRDLIRSRYLLAYRPSGFEPNGKYRPIHLTAERDGKRMQVHVRKGYYARLETPQS